MTDFFDNLDPDDYLFDPDDWFFGPEVSGDHGKEGERFDDECKHDWSG